LGLTKKISLIIGAADSYKALLWASYSSLAFALLTSIPQLGLESSVEAIVSGFKKMLPAVLILVLAWSLAGVTEKMHTAEFISQSVLGNVSPVILPMITFIVAAIVAFSTGSSWGTMAILYPVIIASSWALGLETGLDTESNYAILLNVISCVLAGSVLGDHCSPISDTTILSSLASECDHLAHVRTQMPYALVVGVVSVSMGTLMSSLGVPVWLCFVGSLSILYGIVSYFGKTSQ
jgi:Na+/H+ antiporter NhaC